MRILRRPRQPKALSPVGTLPCSERGCQSDMAMTCAYRDRRGRECSMAFCPDHWALVGPVVYCRRHAGTVSAMGPSTEAGALPELENRGPSLVSWVADEIGPDVEQLLQSVAITRESVKTEGAVKVIYDHERRRRWERSWKLIEPTGVSLRVALTISEDEDDALIEVRVGSTVVARGVPPWISRRRAGIPMGGKVEADQRELFHLFCMNHIAGAVAARRRVGTSLSA